MVSSIEPARADLGAGALMQQGFEALAARDIEGLLPLWDEHTVDVFVALGSEVVGSAALRDFFVQMFEAVPDLDFTVEEILEVDRSIGRSPSGSGT